MLALLLLEPQTTSINSQMFLLEYHLIELNLSLLRLRFIFEQDVGIFAVLRITEVFLYDFSALGPFRLVRDADRAEPYFFNLATSFEEFL